MATSRMPEWMWSIEWSHDNPFAWRFVSAWAEAWYSQERRRKGSWICYDRKQEKEVWNG